MELLSHFISLPENFPLGIGIPFIFLVILISQIYSKNKLRKIFSKENLESFVNQSLVKSWLKYSFLILGLALIFVALLGPKWGYQETIEKQKDIDLVILIDVSKSMLVEDVKPNRLERAKLKINEFIDLASRTKEYRIGLTVFSGSSFVYCPLTRDYGSLRTFVHNISQEMISEQGTDLTLGMETALTTFPEDLGEDQKVMIVFTDGESHEPDVIQMAEDAKNQGIIIYTIGVGTPNGELVPIKNDQGKIIDYLKDEQEQIIISKLDQKTLIEIADLTGGNYFTSELGKNDFEVIIQEINQLSKKNERERILKNQKDQFQIFTLFAFIFIALEFILNERKK